MRKMITFLATAMLLAGCGDDSGTNIEELDPMIPNCEMCEYGSLIDNRDNQVYRTVKIGEQWWMAENLRFAYAQRTAELDSSSVCIENDPEKCREYGRFYTWSAAMDSVGLFSTNGLGCGDGNEICNRTFPVRGICPEGWHLPSSDEVKSLFLAVGGTKDAEKTTRWSNVGTKLTVCEGVNSYGFGAVSPVDRMEFCDEHDGDIFLECNRYFFWWNADHEEVSKHRIDFWTSSLTGFRSYPSEGIWGLRCYDDMAYIDNKAETSDGLQYIRCVKD